MNKKKWNENVMWNHNNNVQIEYTRATTAASFSIATSLRAFLKDGTVFCSYNLPHVKQTNKLAEPGYKIISKISRNACQTPWQWKRDSLSDFKKNSNTEKKNAITIIRNASITF